MAKIKHIAIRTPDPEKTAAFYKDVFGLKEVGQARRGCYLSDGHINLAILKTTDHEPGEAPGTVGLDHFGFLVDDFDDTCTKLDAVGATRVMSGPDQQHVPTGGPRSYYEVKFRGPDEQVFDVSTSGWIGTD